KREARTRVKPINLFGSGGAAGLSETDVEGHQPSANVRKGAIEHRLTALVAIESEMDKRAHKSAALRTAHNNRFGILHVDRIFAAVVVGRRGFEKGTEIACGRKTKAQHQRSLGAINDFIEAARLESGRIADLCVRHRRIAALRTSAE